MERFPIRTFTIATTDQQSVLHSPALPRLGVPYIEVTESRASRLTVVAYLRADSTSALCDGELRVTTSLEEFARFERFLSKAPRQSQGKRYPYAILNDPPCVEFRLEKDEVVDLRLPGGNAGGGHCGSGAREPIAEH